MTPTPRLRFFERAVPAPEYGENLSKTVRTLQQWWEQKVWTHDDWVVLDSEWRDVPIEKVN